MAGGGGGIAVPEPILTCVQCQEEYQESQNAEGYCKYHSFPLGNAGYQYMYVYVCMLCFILSIFHCAFLKYLYSFKCCNQESRNYDSANLLPGCKKGKHCSEHHENYPYAAYTTFIRDIVECACEMHAILF